MKNMTDYPMNNGLYWKGFITEKVIKDTLKPSHVIV